MISVQNKQNGVTRAVKKKQKSAQTRGHEHPRNRSALKPEVTNGGLQQFSKLFLIFHRPH